MLVTDRLYSMVLVHPEDDLQAISLPPKDVHTYDCQAQLIAQRNERPTTRETQKFET